jgi:hypothetical protein
VERHRPLIEAAETADGFEQSMSDLLAELHTSHLGFFHSSARRASSRAALSATYLADETPFGKRWIFQGRSFGRSCFYCWNRTRRYSPKRGWARDCPTRASNLSDG